MRTSQLIKTFLLLLLLQACGSSPPKPVAPQRIPDDGGVPGAGVTLSPQNIQALREAFIGRSVVFKEDWYEYSFIDSDPLGDFSDLIPITRLADWAERRNHRVLIAPRGTVGKITGTRTFYNEFVFICELEGGGQAYLIVLNRRPATIFFGSRNSGLSVQRTSLDDDEITPAWAEYNLTYHTLEFIEALPELPVLQAQPASAKPLPKLTPLNPGNPGGVGAGGPLSRVGAATDPPALKAGQDLQLLLQFRLDLPEGQRGVVRETRSLLYQGQTIPGYPQTQEILRGGGEHVSRITQHVPQGAASGRYDYTARVCVENNCVETHTVFEVLP